MPLPPSRQKQAREKPKEYRCKKCRAKHRYLAKECQSCGFNKLVEIEPDECKACEGSGQSSKGHMCSPCAGTGRAK